MVHQIYQDYEKFAQEGDSLEIHTNYLKYVPQYAN